MVHKREATVNINMTAETPKHGDLVAALADLPPRKVEKFAIALGVPKNVLEESQIIDHIDYVNGIGNRSREP